LALTIGGIAFVKYLTTQAKLLKKICVRSTSLEWREVLSSGLQAYISGTPMPQTIPLELEVVNDSDVEVEVKEMYFDIYFSGIHVASVLNQDEAILMPNSVSNLEIDVNLDLAGDLIDIGLELLSGDNEIELRGNLKIQASVYEEYNYPYKLVVQGNEILEESSGKCE